MTFSWNTSVGWLVHHFILETRKEVIVLIGFIDLVTIYFGLWSLTLSNWLFIVEAADWVSRRGARVRTLTQNWRVLMNVCFMLLLNLVRSIFLLNSGANSCQRKVIKSLSLNLTLEPLTPNVESRRVVLRGQCPVLHLLMRVHVALVPSNILARRNADWHIVPLSSSRLPLATFRWPNLIIVHN